MNWYVPAAYGYDPRFVSSSHAYTPTQSYAEIQGGPLAPDLQGFVVFTDVPYGTDVFVEVSGLPAAEGQQPIGPFFGFHLHEKGTCAIGDPANPFQASGEHWNPTNQPHPHHAGDLPVLLSNSGYARMNFFTNRFRAADVIGKTVMIHQNPDDYRTQPAGNSGKRLACGLIVAG